mmetsp:Transcript_43681/g.56018  ORF Transcript_43681/g.56018 Transcript_43681/m.56018 type:complete len:166 (-) Transcript_43681:19-516(-)
MPRKAIDYSKTIIYKLQHIEDESLLYVGSTTDFTRRKSKHKYDCTNLNSNNYNQKKNQMIRLNGGWEMFQMIEIEKYYCVDNREAEAREDYWIRQLKTNMNSNRAHYSCNNKIEYNKQYYNDNKITINTKKYEKVTCECGCMIRRDYLSKHCKSKKHIQLMEQKN